jgi:hypothetical protein
MENMSNGKKVVTSTTITIAMDGLKFFEVKCHNSMKSGRAENSTINNHNKFKH